MELKLTQRQKLRDKVYSKFNGRCAYTGLLLDNVWQIDHVTPRAKEKGAKTVIANNIDNLLPTFSFINKFKNRRSLEEWRDYLNNFHLKLDKSRNKKGDGKKVRHRAIHLNKLAEYFKISYSRPFEGLFYFEKYATDAPTHNPHLARVYLNNSLNNLDGEAWLPAIGFNGYYMCSNLGRIKSILRVDSKGQTRKESIKKQQINKGHLTSLLSADKFRTTKRIARVIAEAFIPNPNGLRNILHKDGDKLNCNRTNLIWSKKMI